MLAIMCLVNVLSIVSSHQAITFNKSFKFYASIAGCHTISMSSLLSFRPSSSLPNSPLNTSSFPTWFRLHRGLHRRLHRRLIRHRSIGIRYVLELVGTLYLYLCALETGTGRSQISRNNDLQTTYILYVCMRINRQSKLYKQYSYHISHTSDIYFRRSN